MDPARTRHAASADGTRIAFRTTGQGPHVLLVHGSAGDHRDWTPVAALLSANFTVHTMDRRGRGASGDAKAYAVDREAEDVAAVLAAIGAPAAVVAHSYGALVALEAARILPHASRLVLYEPPIFAEPLDPSAADFLDDLVHNGDAEGALVTFLREIAGASDAELAAARADEALWRAAIATAPTLGREVRADFGYRFDAARFAAVQTPTLLLTGSESPPFFGDAIAAVHRALPSSRVEVLPGQAHSATTMAPKTFADIVTRFLQ